MNVYKKKLIIGKNNAKEIMHNPALKVNGLCQTLQAKECDEGELVKTNTWTPLLANINEM